MKYAFIRDIKSTYTLRLTDTGIDAVLTRSGGRESESFIPYAGVTAVSLYTSDVGAVVCRIDRADGRKPLLVPSHSINEARTAFVRSPHFDPFLTALHRKLAETGKRIRFHEGHPALYRLLKAAALLILLGLTAGVPGLIYLLIAEMKRSGLDLGLTIVTLLWILTAIAVVPKLLKFVILALLAGRAAYEPDNIPARYLSPESDTASAQHGEPGH